MIFELLIGVVLFYTTLSSSSASPSGTHQNVRESTDREEYIQKNDPYNSPNIQSSLYSTNPDPNYKRSPSPKRRYHSTKGEYQPKHSIYSRAEHIIRQPEDLHSRGYGEIQIPQSPYLPIEEKEISNIKYMLGDISKKLMVDYKYETIPSLESVIVIPTRGISHVENKRIIRLKLLDNHGALYDRNTINRAALHEFSHILCPEENHTLVFKMIEDKVLALARELGYIDSNGEFDPSYPCMVS